MRKPKRGEELTWLVVFKTSDGLEFEFAETERDAMDTARGIEEEGDVSFIYVAELRSQFHAGDKS